MRAREIIGRYRALAAHTHILMAVLAFGLVFAILALMLVSAVPSHADFLTAEAKNIVAGTPASDLWPLAAAALAVAVKAFIGGR